jgi:quinol---cytochrome-c reductase cytochrome c subunit
MRRTVRLFAALALLTVVLLPVTGGSGAAARHSAGQEIALERRGRLLYEQACAACHGSDPAGPSRYPTVPSLADVGGAAAVDWALRTGRMPWKSANGPALRGEPRFLEQDIRALATYVGRAVGDTEIPSADPRRGDLQRGRDLYATTCAACHSMNGTGGSVGGEHVAPPLTGVSPLTLAEAMQIGPGVMPVFGGDAYTQQDVDDIAAYVQTLDADASDPGGLPLGGTGPVAEGFVAWVIGLGLLVLAARLIAGAKPHR